MYDMSDDFIQMFMTNTIGESILVETLKSAAYFITRSNGSFHPKHHVTKAYLQEAGYCYFFVQSTGLDLLIERYRLDYDPSEVRNVFNYYVRHTS